MVEHMTKEELKERIADLEWEDFEAKTAKSEVKENFREEFYISLKMARILARMRLKLYKMARILARTSNAYYMQFRWTIPCLSLNFKS